MKVMKHRHNFKFNFLVGIVSSRTKRVQITQDTTVL